MENIPEEELFYPEILGEPKDEFYRTTIMIVRTSLETAADGLESLLSYASDKEHLDRAKKWIKMFRHIAAL